MCNITATEFKKNLGYYLTLCSKEDIFISKNGKVIGCLSSSTDKGMKKLIELGGCLKDYDDGKDYDAIILEEMKKKWNF